MGTTFIYHKKDHDDERSRMEHDYQVVTSRKGFRSRLVNLSDKWNRIVEAIAAAASFSSTRDRSADQEKEDND